MESYLSLISHTAAMRREVNDLSEWQFSDQDLQDSIRPIR